MDMTFEGYGPGGVAFLVQALTNNKNRATQFIRNIFLKNGGNLGNSGSVAWMFPQKGLLMFESLGQPEERLMESVLESGGEDMELLQDEGKEIVQVICDPKQLVAVKTSLEKKGVPVKSAQLIHLPSSTISEMSEEDKEQLTTLIDQLDENEDVQNVTHNFTPNKEE